MNDVDPVEELHKIRRAICKKAGGTTADYFRYYLEMDKEKASGSKDTKAVISGKPKAEQNKPRQQPAKPRAKAIDHKSRQQRKVLA